jgi:hypothetical protein
VFEVSPNIFEMKYVIKGKLYKMRLKVQNGPGNVLQINDKDMNDLTEKIEPYINFYDSEIVQVTPCDFNCNEVYIETFDGNSIKFNKMEPLILKNKIN